MKAPVNEIVLTVISVVIALIAVVVGLFIFFSRYEYAESGQDYLVMGYVAACLILFFGVRLWNIPLFVISLLILGGVMTYSIMKFDWREHYIESAKAGQPFALEEYIDHYPSFEEHLFKIMEAPDWVGFNDECVQPALAGKAVEPECNSTDSIQEHYNIDIKASMIDHYARMKNTAKQIQAGKMNSRSAYTACLKDKTCATIPLLPKGVDANKIDPTGQDYLEIRESFWSIITEKHMSAKVCDLTPVCKALVAMKAVDPRRLPF